MPQEDGFRERAQRALARSFVATDPAVRRELEKLAEAYQVLADQADGTRPLHTRYPNTGTGDRHVS
jgi:hypothetical protein